MIHKHLLSIITTCLQHWNYLKQTLSGFEKAVNSVGSDSTSASQIAKEAIDRGEAQGKKLHVIMKLSGDGSTSLERQAQLRQHLSRCWSRVQTQRIDAENYSTPICEQCLNFSTGLRKVCRTKWPHSVTLDAQDTHIDYLVQVKDVPRVPCALCEVSRRRANTHVLRTELVQHQQNWTNSESKKCSIARLSFVGMET